MYRLASLILNIVLIAHSFACIWIYIGFYEISLKSTNTWLVNPDIELKDNFSVYINALYFSTVTMITVGYGDISPKGLLDKCFGIVFIFICCGVFAFSINTIGLIIIKMNKEEEEFHKLISDTEFYLNNRKVKHDLKLKILRYLEYMFVEKTKTANNVKESLMSTLSEPLKKELLNEHYFKILKEDSFLNLFSDDLIKKLTEITKEASFAPGELIINADSSGHRNPIFFVVLSGDIELYSKDQKNFHKPFLLLKVIICSLRKDNPSEQGIFYFKDQKESQPKAKVFPQSATSPLRFSSLCSKNIKTITLTNFIKEKFCMHREKITSNEINQVSCLLCQQPFHDLKNCKLMNLRINSKNIILKSKERFNQPRDIFHRKNAFKFSCLKRCFEVYFAIEEISRKFRYVEIARNSFGFKFDLDSPKSEGIVFQNESEESDLSFQEKGLEYPHMLQNNSGESININTLQSVTLNSISPIPEVSNFGTHESIESKGFHSMTFRNSKKERISNLGNLEKLKKKVLFMNQRKIKKITIHKNSIELFTDFSRNSVDSGNSAKSGLLFEKEFENPNKNVIVVPESQNNLLKDHSLNNFQFLLQFDKMKNYNYYFPDFNLKVLIEKETKKSLLQSPSRKASKVDGFSQTKRITIQSPLNSFSAKKYSAFEQKREVIRLNLSRRFSEDTNQDFSVADGSCKSRMNSSIKVFHINSGSNDSDLQKSDPLDTRRHMNRDSSRKLSNFFLPANQNQKLRRVLTFKDSQTESNRKNNESDPKCQTQL